ncbi:hypothetical protein J3R30DRAFT_735900 [Lentinula aciculospora]|uniref:Uncharacterized protein n=1 Tax=Lentinula aciculospora TaxID=153920 RepID=A0A9W9A440_9AGAR|nr:hypothetical protein J3R30DRAFT_735900 [Lentinula aciculospora]
MGFHLLLSTVTTIATSSNPVSAKSSGTSLASSIPEPSSSIVSVVTKSSNAVSSISRPSSSFSTSTVTLILKSTDLNTVSNPSALSSFDSSVLLFLALHMLLKTNQKLAKDLCLKTKKIITSSRHLTSCSHVPLWSLERSYSHSKKQCYKDAVLYRRI